MEKLLCSNRTHKILNMAAEMSSNTFDGTSNDVDNENIIYADLQNLQDALVLDIPEVTNLVAHNIPYILEENCEVEKVLIQNKESTTTIIIETEDPKEYSENDGLNNDPDYIEEYHTMEETDDQPSDRGDVKSEKRKRSKRQHVSETSWGKNKNARKREKGQDYYGKKKCNGVWNYEIPRERRRLKDVCNCKMSAKNKGLQCMQFDEIERDQIFKSFWSEKTLWDQRKVYINLLVKKESTKRQRNRKNEAISRRSFTWTYFLKKRNEENLRVCKKMFLNTLGLNERTVIDWKNETSDEQKNENEETDNEINLIEVDAKSRREILKEFFNTLPKVESHYCRARSSKLYLEPNWNSKSALFTFYKNWCKDQNYVPVSIALFFHVFEDMNLSLFKPKKDECDTCVGYRNKNISEENYALHQIKKQESREAKQLDKGSNNRVFCMDMQAVLLSPKSNTSALYFKMKLMVHNFTIYDMKSGEGYCFIWHEAAGGVSANNYSSIICFFLLEYVFKRLENGIFKIRSKFDKSLTSVEQFLLG